MSGLNLLASAQNESSAGLSLFPNLWTAGLDDYILSAAWSAEGDYLAVLPSEQQPAIFNVHGHCLAKLATHRGGNGSVSWHPCLPRLLTYGQDREVRVYDFTKSVSPQPLFTHKVGSGWAEHAAWNADGTLLATALGRELLIWDAQSGSLRQRLCGHASTICHFCWNPCQPAEVATVGDGGAKMWRVGQEEPFAHFSWGGASLYATWSRDGRWLVTADQTPSLHLFDFQRQEPLHIQGFSTRVKALAWQGEGEALATSHVEQIAIWPTTGHRGPEGARPVLLDGHRATISSLAFPRQHHLLASGDENGTTLLWAVGRSEVPAMLEQTQAEITCLTWSPDGSFLFLANAEGFLSLYRLPTIS